MKALRLGKNLPAENQLAIAFKATAETKLVLMELARLFGEVAGDAGPLNVSATIRTCIHFTYARREAIMMARLRAQRKRANECPIQPASQTGQANASHG